MIASFAAWYSHGEPGSLIFWENPKIPLDQFYALSPGSEVMNVVITKQKTVAR